MTFLDALVLLFGLPIAFVGGCWLGRKAQRSMWHLDKPYSERVRLLKGGRS